MNSIQTAFFRDQCGEAKLYQQVAMSSKGHKAPVFLGVEGERGWYLCRDVDNLSHFLFMQLLSFLYKQAVILKK